jgi:hypothetical protein
LAKDLSQELVIFAFTTPSGMICTITETTLNKDFNDVLVTANGVVKVLATDVV